MRTESGLEGHRGESCKSFGMMVARDGVEPPTPAFSATLCCVLNNLSDFRWPPKYLRSRERHANRGLKSWVQNHCRDGVPALAGSSRFCERRFFLATSSDKPTAPALRSSIIQRNRRVSPDPSNAR